MQNSYEKLCLQQNEFRNNVSSAFGDLTAGKDFTDVTLAWEIVQQVEAHEVVLSQAKGPLPKKTPRDWEEGEGRGNCHIS